MASREGVGSRQRPSAGRERRSFLAGARVRRLGWRGRNKRKTSVPGSAMVGIPGASQCKILLRSSSDAASFLDPSLPPLLLILSLSASHILRTASQSDAELCGGLEGGSAVPGRGLILRRRGCGRAGVLVSLWHSPGNVRAPSLLYCASNRPWVSLLTLPTFPLLRFLPLWLE